MSIPISIVVPVYNREKDVLIAIQSILEQNYNDWELIVCDNASSDRTVEVVKTFEDKRIRVIENTTNFGPMLNWKIGVEAAQFEWVKILFSDDYFKPNALNEFAKGAKKIGGSAGFVLDGEVELKSGWIKTKRFLNNNLVTHRQYIVSPTVALFRRRDLLDAFNTSFSVNWDEYGKKTGAGYDLLAFLNTAVRADFYYRLQKRYTVFGRGADSITLKMKKEGKKKKLIKHYYLTQKMFIRNGEGKNLPFHKRVYYYLAICTHNIRNQIAK